MVVILVAKDFHALYRSDVPNIVHRSGEFILTRGSKMDGRLYGTDMLPKLILYW